MPNIKAKEIVRNYANKLKAENYPFSAMYLFGSYGKGKAKNKWSDIDVAIITNKLKRNYDKNRFLLWDLRMDVDTRIEPHSFTEKDFADNCDPMVSEIKKTGIRVV